MDDRPTEPFAEDLWFAECPRWRDGGLYLSDMWDHRVYRFAEDGTRTLVALFDDDEDPGGIGWHPDGRLLVIGMEGRRVYAVSSDGEARVFADLREFAPHKCNDMIVASDGTAYVTQHGFDTGDLTKFQPTNLLAVAVDGTVSVAADDLHAPNGVALDRSGRVLAVAEPLASRVSLFDRAADGSLSARRVLTRLEPAPGMPFAAPDGICFDRTGAIWMGEPNSKRVLRIDTDGAITDEISFASHPLAVALGGADRRTLFICLAEEMFKSRRTTRRLARLVTLRVSEPGDGTP